VSRPLSLSRQSDHLCETLHGEVPSGSSTRRGDGLQSEAPARGRLAPWPYRSHRLARARRAGRQPPIGNVTNALVAQAAGLGKSGLGVGCSLRRAGAQPMQEADAASLCFCSTFAARGPSHGGPHAVVAEGHMTATTEGGPPGYGWASRSGDRVTHYLCLVVWLGPAYRGGASCPADRYLWMKADLYGCGGIGWAI